MGRSRIFNVDDYALHDLSSERALYLLGFICADGYLSSRQPRIGIDIDQRDQVLLEQFRSFLKYEGAILNGSGSLKRLMWTSVPMSARVRSYGLTTRKSYDLGPLQISIDPRLQHHLLRGYFDGDGCWSYGFIGSKGYPSYRREIRMELRGTPEFCHYLKTLSPIELNYSFHKTGRLRLSKRETVRHFGDWLYQDATIYLPRKYNLFKTTTQ